MCVRSCEPRPYRTTLNLHVDMCQLPELLANRIIRTVAPDRSGLSAESLTIYKDLSSANPLEARLARRMSRQKQIYYRGRRVKLLPQPLKETRVKVLP